jgi:ribose transport system permease protein
MRKLFGTQISRGVIQRAVAQGTVLLGVGGFFIILIIFFSFRAENFFTGRNAINVLENVAVLGVVTLGQAMVLISGGFDLSVSGTVPLGGVIFVILANHHFGNIVSVLAAVLVGIVVGLVNGLVITRLGINPLITTLATVSITGGVAYTASNGLTITLNNPSNAPLGNNFGGVPIYVWAFIVLSIVAFVVMRYTVLGRTLYAIGGNREATRLAGLRVDAVTVLVYVISGVLASFGGVMLAQQLLAGAPTVGANEGLQSITAVILGGASLMGGTGGIPGTLIGVLVLGTVANGMALMQVQTFYQQMATGVILLLAVSLGRLRLVLEHLIWSRSQEEDTAPSGEPENQPANLTDVVDQAKGG